MDIGSILLGLALVLFIAFIVAQPVLDKQGIRETQRTAHDSLVVAREQALTALRDLDFDHATGKITDDDYAPQRVALVAHSAAILKQLDTLYPSPASAAPEPEPALPMEDFIEAEIARRRATPVNGHVGNGRSASAPARGHVCPHCQSAVQADDRFCPKCGTSLTLTCGACGQALQADDRFCPKCGAQQIRPQPAL